MAVLRRYAYWQVLRDVRIPGVDVGAQEELDRAAVTFARVVHALNAGAFQLAAWSDERGKLTLGVVQRGGKDSELGLWPLIPLVVAGGAAAYGGWILVDAWLAVRALEARTDAARAQAQVAATAAVAAAPNAEAAAKIADALERANRAAANVQPGLLDRLAGAAGAISQTVKDSSGTALLVLAGLWLWSRRRA